MRIKEEKGITLVTLVITIIVLIIIAGIGVTTSKTTVKSSKYEVFQTELKLMQSKVNEITEQYQKENKQIGEELRSSDNQIINSSEVTEQLNIKAQNAGITVDEIKNDFRLCTVEYIEQTLGVENITRDYLVNLKRCIVISAECFEYEGTNYYMQEQMEEGLYNVTYNNQIATTGDFTVTANATGEGYKITITPEHQKYVSKWQVKYRLQGSTYWKTTNDLTFTVDEQGTYEIQVTHGDEIDLGTKTVTIE